MSLPTFSLENLQYVGELGSLVQVREEVSRVLDHFIAYGQSYR